MNNNSFSSPNIINCTFTANYAQYFGGAIYNWDTSCPRIVNSILWGNRTDFNPQSQSGTQMYTNSTCEPIVIYSDVTSGGCAHSNCAMEGGLSVDPRFVSSLDLRLQLSSPGIDKGTATGAPGHDLDGKPRPLGPYPDMGAYEYGLTNQDPGKENYLFIAAGSANTCAITSSRSVECWGDNSFGQLGDGTTAGRSNPGPVLGLNNTVVDLAVGWAHACAVLSSGELWCWGNNDYGQLGNGATLGRSAPVRSTALTVTAVRVTAGKYHTCVLTNAGGIKCWGNNNNGQLGDGTQTNRLSPVNVTGLTSGVSALAARGGGDGFSGVTCALNQQGSIFCWGANSQGQLGDGKICGSSCPIPTPVLADPP